MEEMKYKIMKLISQLIAITIIFSNIDILALSLYNYQLLESEKESVSELVMTYQVSGLYVIGLNLIFGLLNISVATSGNKYYLKIYIRSNILYLLISSIIVMFVFFLFLSIFGSYV